MPLTNQQELEIYPILDKALEQEPNKGILYKCTAKRADYLTRMIQGLRYDSAIESIEMYRPDEPLYGLGSYSNIWVEPHEQGLLATKLPSPYLNLMWRLIQCAAHHQPVMLPDVSFNHARQRLARAQKKYPATMNRVYITEGDPDPVAKYGESVAEELLIVDIDVNPDKRVRAPSDEDIAKAGMPMQNPPYYK